MQVYSPIWVKRGNSQKELLKSVSTLEPMTENLLRDYEELAGTPYVWEGLDKIDMTDNHMESLLFWNTHIGIGETKLRYYVMGAKAGKVTIYGEPSTWSPVGTNVTDLPLDLIREYNSEKNPCMKIGEQSVADRITDECIWQASTYISLNQNVVGMRAPVMITGTDGNAEIDYIEDNLIQGRSIPALKKAGIGAEVQDMKAQNFVDPLSGYAEFLHNKTLGKLGIDALGTQKASGITQEEAVLILAQIKGIRKKGLRIRERLCDMINGMFGSEITVVENDIYLDMDMGNNYSETPGMGSMAGTDDNKE